jgi:hypothetical protein
MTPIRALPIYETGSSIFPEENTWTELMRMLRSADTRADAGECDSIWKSGVIRQAT